jgi:ABC-type transport system involved in cytochrome bd biosynthesis fused ATPase/permease subunit
VDEDKRWQRASESDDRFSPFRRRQPIVVGLVTALIALISLAIFLSIAGLDIGQFLIATLVSITVMTLAGCCFTLLSNHRAKSSYLAEYRRLNKVNADSDHKKASKSDALVGSKNSSEVTPPFTLLPEVITQERGGPGCLNVSPH